MCYLSRSKADLSSYPGLLQPLLMPTLIWSEISMDFVEGLSNSNGKTVIMVVVDRLTKYSHFMTLSHPFTAIQVALVFLDNVYKLHGLPKVIVSDRDKVFLSLFWKELFEMLQVSLHFSTAYHPQIDGILSSPILYSLGQSNVDSVDKSLAAREAIIKMLQFHLDKAQARMKAATNLHRTNKSFKVGQWVVNKVGKVAYKSLLPLSAQIHPVFHVSQLKLFKGDPISVPPVLPQCDPNGSLVRIPVKVLERKMVKVNNKMVIYVLVQWSNGTINDAT
ncbi:retrotransposable element Tf2 [Tanacetum coccineum]